MLRTFNIDAATAVELAEDLGTSVGAKRLKVDVVVTEASMTLETNSVEGMMLSCAVGNEVGGLVKTDFLGRTNDRFPYMALLEIL